MSWFEIAASLIAAQAWIEHYPPLPIILCSIFSHLECKKINLQNKTIQNRVEEVCLWALQWVQLRSQLLAVCTSAEIVFLRTPVDWVFESTNVSNGNWCGLRKSVVSIWWDYTRAGQMHLVERLESVTQLKPLSHYSALMCRSWEQNPIIFQLWNTQFGVQLAI